MTNVEATRRYFKVFVPSMLMFVAGSFALAWFGREYSPPQMLMVFLAIIPVSALVGLFWIHFRYMNELDEFLRAVQGKALLFGAMVALVIATTWGYLENYADVEPLPLFWLNPIFWVSYAASALFLTKRDGGSWE